MQRDCQPADGAATGWAPWLTFNQPGNEKSLQQSTSSLQSTLGNSGCLTAILSLPLTPRKRRMSSWILCPHLGGFRCFWSKQEEWEKYRPTRSQITLSCYGILQNVLVCVSCLSMRFSFDIPKTRSQIYKHVWRWSLYWLENTTILPYCVQMCFF